MSLLICECVVNDSAITTYYLLFGDDDEHIFFTQTPVTMYESKNQYKLNSHQLLVIYCDSVIVINIGRWQQMAVALALAVKCIFISFSPMQFHIFCTLHSCTLKVQTAHIAVDMTDGSLVGWLVIQVNRSQIAGWIQMPMVWKSVWANDTLCQVPKTEKCIPFSRFYSF